MTNSRHIKCVQENLFLYPLMAVRAIGTGWVGFGHQGDS